MALALRMEEFLSFLQQFNHFSPAEEALICQHCKLETRRKKDFLLQAGTVSRNLWFIRKGLVRLYYIDDGSEISTYFATDGQVFTSFSSFISQTPSFEYIECLEECDMVTISHEQMQSLYERIPHWERLGRILAESNYKCILNRSISLQVKNGTERYLEFLHSNPFKIVQQVPQHQIASFLGIKAESLSRIKKNLKTT